MRSCGIGISFLAAYLLAGGEALCQPQASEYDLKAAFIYNFAKFTVWPTNAFLSATSPLVIGVLGNDPVTPRLKQMLENKKLEGRPLLVTEPESAAEARTNCHLLFISSSERQRLPKILADLDGSSVLTVSETEQFLEAGGMINFGRIDTKIRFKINDEAARKADLKIPSKLLNLAK